MGGVAHKRILVAPLDWGLGHATRCIPIIRMLQQRGCEVAIASSADALTLLRQEFPELQHFDLPSYRARYSTRLPLMVKVFLQLPKLVAAIFKEHRWLRQILRTHSFDWVISDNRYGCWSARTPSIFITHQVNLLMPAGFGWLAGILNYFNHQAIRRFDGCWIPDYPDDPLTGKLSRPVHPHTTFVGMLSRFHPRPSSIEISYPVVAILSGPEPQRAKLEMLLIAALKNFSTPALIVRGLPGKGSRHCIGEHITVVDHLPSQELNEVIFRSELVICRSGYSSVMDLAFAGRKALFIPTPGQTEQEYLASKLMRMGVAGYQHQSQLDLKSAWRERNHYKGFEDWKHQHNLLSQAVNKILQ